MRRKGLAKSQEKGFDWQSPEKEEFLKGRFESWEKDGAGPQHG